MMAALTRGRRGARSTHSRYDLSSGNVRNTASQCDRRHGLGIVGTSLIRLRMFARQPRRNQP